MNGHAFIRDPGYAQHPGLVYAPLPGPPENYVLVQTAPQRTAPPGPVRLPGQGRNFIKNMWRRQRREAQEQIGAQPYQARQIQMDQGSVRVTGQDQPTGNNSGPMVPQPRGNGILQVAMQEAGVAPTPVEQPVSRSEAGPSGGYQTAEYMRSQKLIVVGVDQISPDRIIKSITKLYNYAYAFAKCLVSPARGPREDIVKAWHYTRNGVVVKTGANLLHVIMEINTFFHKHGCPVKECPFLKPAITAINIPEPENERILEGILDPEFLDLEYAELIAKVNSITGSGVYKTVQEAVKVMEGYMPIYIRYSAAVYQPCIRFTLNPDQLKVGKEPLEVFNEAASHKYSGMFQQLNYYLYKNHVPTLGTSAVEKILKPLGLSVDKFFGFIQCGSRAEEEAKDDGSYPSGTALQELFGFSSEWANVKDVLMNQVAPHLAQITRNAELIYEGQAKLEEIYTLVSLMADLSNLKSKNVDVLNTGSEKLEQNKLDLRTLLKNYQSKNHGPADRPVTVTGPADKPVNVTGPAYMEPELEKDDPLMEEAEI